MIEKEPDSVLYKSSKFNYIQISQDYCDIIRLLHSSTVTVFVYSFICSHDLARSRDA